jgi:hypothetical protein
MRKPIHLVALLIAISALAIGIGIAQVQAGPSGPTSSGSGGKQLPTPHSYSVADKHTTPSPYISSCPLSHLPQPGVEQGPLPNFSNSSYSFQSAATGVSGGQPYFILAGYARSNPTQGVISVQPISLDPCKDFVAHLGKSASQASAAMPVWTAPSQTGGAITLTGVSGNTVSYTTASGKAGHFDYTTKTFLP